MKFDQFGLDERIVKAIAGAGYTVPTSIQQQAIPKVMEGHDVLGLAQTGTGKTAAFTLPILQRLLKGPQRRVRALVVAPTRELAEQILQTSVTLGKNSKVRCVAVYGGVSKKNQASQIRKGVELVIACPGRLLDLVGDGDIDLSQTEVLVLDEADRMCDMGFIPDIRRIIKLLPSKRQTLFFAATMPEDIRKLTNNILRDPVKVQIGTISPAKSVSHALYPVPDKLKKALFFAMLEQTRTGRVLVFTRTKYRARSLARDLQKRGYRATALQGNMSQNKRQRAIDGFRGRKYDVLVATDVASRGIDVSDISHVINFDIPDSADTYTHRIGRTGRVDRLGEAFTLAGSSDGQMVRVIEKILGKPIERRRLETFDYGKFKPENQFQVKDSSSRRAKPSRKRGSRNRNRARRNKSKAINRSQKTPN